MRRDGDIPGFDSKAAVASRGLDIGCNISGIGRADVHDGPEGAKGTMLLLNGRQGIMGRRVRIAFAVVLADRHDAIPPFRADIGKGVHL